MTHQPGLSKREQASAVMQLRSAQGSGPKVLLLHSFFGAKFTEHEHNNTNLRKMIHRQTNTIADWTILPNWKRCKSDVTISMYDEQGCNSRPLGSVENSDPVILLNFCDFMVLSSTVNMSLIGSLDLFSIQRLRI